MSRTLQIVILALVTITSDGLLAQPTLRITSPKDRTIVNPGGTVVVNVSASGAPFLGVIVIPHDPIGVVEGLTSPPYQFSVAIPMTIRPGLYTLTAMGRTTPAGDPVSSSPVSIDVERPDSPVSITADLTTVELPVGGKMDILVTGKYSDGSTVDLSSSTKTTYVSQATGIATVDAYGYITAVAPGLTSIVIHHGDRQTVVKAIVSAPQ
jgi:hypothetical protein